MNEGKKVLVIMSTYNGEKYLQEQIDSLLEQVGVQVTLIIRDDGSKDNTSMILQNYSEKNTNIYVSLGKNIGFRKSFYTTLVQSFDEYDYYAFSDQDDVWCKNKLLKAIEALEKENIRPALYASALKVVDQNLNFMYDNTFDKLNITYGSAISRQRLAGCTMVFNKDLFRLCQFFSMTDELNNLFSHDGAVYFICLACGGKVLFDRNSYIRFRRHEGTVTEHGKGLLKRMQSVFNIFSELKNSRFFQVSVLYKIYENYMPKEEKELSMKVIHYRDSVANTICLAFDKRLESGLKSVDLINKVAILMRCY